MLSDDSLQSYPTSPFDWPWSEVDKLNSYNIFAHENSTSGGYSEHIFKFAAKELFNQDLVKVEYTNLR